MDATTSKVAETMFPIDHGDHAAGVSGFELAFNSIPSIIDLLIERCQCD